MGLLIMQLRLFTLFFLLFSMCSQPAFGQVKGHCATCHTMHNSQNNAKMVYMGSIGGSWAGWNGSTLNGGNASPGPQPTLLATDCVGCHTSNNSDTIITVGDNKIPIVFNTVTPVKPLAGGNFFWVAQSGGDARGHNVRGISGKDAVLDMAPGTLGCDSTSCHDSLTYPDHEKGKNGCQGCHQGIKHHGTTVTSGNPAGADEGYYRFLCAPQAHIDESLGGGCVNGIEDANWEQNATASTHNIYYGGNGTVDMFDEILENPESMGKFCAGCHGRFHSPGHEQYYVANGGGDDPWLRHPADSVIPASGEYASYTVYNTTVPVARPPSLFSITNANIVTPGSDKVFCLSCHRAHGSQYMDMLRWDYNKMDAGTTGPSAGTGCFKCYSKKDGVT